MFTVVHYGCEVIRAGKTVDRSVAVFVKVVCLFLFDNKKRLEKSINTNYCLTQVAFLGGV